MPVHELLLKRRSGRIIDPDRPVSHEDIYILLEAARWAPSCANNQPWRFVVSTGHAMGAVKACLSKGNQWAHQAPLIITVASKPDLGCQRTGRDYYPLDLGLAIENMLLQGIAIGLVMHPIAGFDENQLKINLNIPEPYRVYALVVSGYPGSAEGVDDRVLEKEQIPRLRNELDSMVFWDRWNAD